MTRRQARELVLQLLFQYEFTGKIPDRGEILSILEKRRFSDGTIDFIEDIFNGTIRHLNEIDTIIQSISKNWELKRFPSVDRNILRFAAYELLYRDDISPPVTINEAIDIAKKYSGPESYSFINGLLDKIARNLKTLKA